MFTLVSNETLMSIRADILEELMDVPVGSERYNTLMWEWDGLEKERTLREKEARRRSRQR